MHDLDPIASNEPGQFGLDQVRVDGGVVVATDGRMLVAQEYRSGDKFPDWRPLIPTEKPVFEIVVNPARLIELLKIIPQLDAGLCGKCNQYADDASRCRLSFFGEHRVMAISTVNTEQKTTVGLLMPCATNTAECNQSSESVFAEIRDSAEPK